jgi:hypothetical protein
MPRFVFPRFSRNKDQAEGIHPSLIPPGPYNPFGAAAQAPEETARAAAPTRQGWASDRFTEDTTEQQRVAG